MSAPPSESFRSRPLPPAPTDPPVIIGSYPTESRSGTQTQNSGYSASDRNSILTFTSVGSNLPQYAAIDFLDPNFSLEQVDHWSEVGDSLVAVAGSDASSSITSPENQPPEYTLGQTAPRYSSRQRPRFVLHKFHQGGQSKKIDPHKSQKKSTQTPWATLKLVSRPPALGSRVKTPRFIGGDVIRGSVDLSMSTPMNVHSIKLIVSCAPQINTPVLTIFWKTS